MDIVLEIDTVDWQHGNSCSGTCYSLGHL